MDTIILTQRDVARLLNIPTAIRSVGEAFKRHAQGEAAMPSKVYLNLPKGDFRAMPASLSRPKASGLKWVNVHPGNRKRGLPTVMAVILINDPDTGRPLAILDGSLITKLRTAAAGAVAAEALARRDSQQVGLVGCGAQADAQILALAEVIRFKAVSVWGFLPGEAARFCRGMSRRLPRVHFTPVATVQACVREADVVVTLTPSRKPLVRRDWIRPGTHINAIGADAPGKQELDSALLRAGRVIVDEIEQSIHGGEINVPVSTGQFSPDKIHASLGEVLLGRKSGRRDRKMITIFDSTGLAIHDIAMGYEAYRRALRRRVGMRVALGDLSA